MREKAWAMVPVWDPAAQELVAEHLSRHVDGLADEKYGEGCWRRVSFEAMKFDQEPLRNDRQAVALFMTEGDREAADDLLEQIPEGACMWRATATYEPLEAPDA